MTALTDTLSWGAVDGATGYLIGVRDTTAPASQVGTYFWFASSAGPSITIGQLVRGALASEALPAGRLLAAAVQAQIAALDANGFITDLTESEWSAEFTFTVDASAPQSASNASSVAGKVGALGSSAAQAPTLAAPPALAVSSS